MRRISWRLRSLAVISALLQIACFPIAGALPVWRALLAWFALVPLLYALTSERPGTPLTIKQGAALGYLCGVVWYVGNCYWIYQTMYVYGGLPKPVALGILCLFGLYLGLYHAVFAVLVVTVRRMGAGAAGALGFAPFAWVAVELARARITGFPWDLLGNSQVDGLWLSRLATVTGVMGLSFVLVCANAAFTSFFSCARPRGFVSGVMLAAVCSLQLGEHLHHARPTVELNATAVLMQENLQVGAVGRESRPLSRGQELDLFREWSMHPLVHVTESQEWVPQAPGLRPDLVVWPEAPSHLESNDPVFRAGLGELAGTLQAPLIAGSLGVDISTAAERGYLLYDSASLFDKTGTYRGRYDKIHLVPWGEYVPFKRFFSFAQKLTEGVGDMDRGRNRAVFDTGGHAYGVFICYESIFGDEVRQFVRNGATVLVNISDDGWYGDTGAPWQHLNMARMRAIENHRWVLRSTNTGITTAIDPYGRVAFEAPRHVRGAYVFPFGYERDETFYTRHGDWFAWICAAVTAAGLSYRRRMN